VPPRRWGGARTRGPHELTRVVAGALLGTDAEAPSPAHQLRGVHAGADLPGAGRRVEHTAGRAIDAGSGHLVLSLPAPYPAGVVREVVDEVVAASSGRRRTVPVDQALPNITVQ